MSVAHELSNDVLIQVCLSDEPQPTLHLIAKGVVTLPMIRDALTELERLRTAHPLAERLLIDTVGVSRFGRGAVLELARWIPRHFAKAKRVELRTHSAQLRSTVGALAMCAPELKTVCELVVISPSGTFAVDPVVSPSK